MTIPRELHAELLEIADRLDQWGRESESSDVKKALDRLDEAATAIGKAWSGSWLGYHARVYYRNLKAPPPGAHFSQEWGLKETWAIEDTTGEWEEFDEEGVENAIYKLAQNPDLKRAKEIAEAAYLKLKATLRKPRFFQERSLFEACNLPVSSGRVIPWR
jgi:hypothetical protein